MRFSIFCLVFLSGFWIGEVRSEAWGEAYDRLNLSDIKEANVSQKIFRFTLLKSGMDDDYSYSLYLAGEPKLLVRKYSKEEGRLYDEEYAVTVRELENLKRLEFASGFWKLPTYVDRKGFDGALWVLEGVRADGVYNRTERWSPLPPYYSRVRDRETGELVRSPNTPEGADVKGSDEIGLDLFCLYILLMNPKYDGLIY